MNKLILLFCLTIAVSSAKAQTNTNSKNNELNSSYEMFFSQFSTDSLLNKVNKISKPLQKPENKENLSENDFYLKTIDNIIMLGKTMLGIPYSWGGTSERGFDCSGYIGYLFKWFGIHLPRTSREIVNVGTYVPKEELKKGDLLFFSGRNGSTIGHIAFVIENNNGTVKMMHSSSSKGVNIDVLNDNAYFNQRYITARRVEFNKN
ncbi:MAG: C40 family peptidase [Chitinophagales bacterium]|jgi:cell wall-associated NlpC family hydrolase|nr:C40 family peptidase [Chitinophagales bacterium]